MITICPQLHLSCLSFPNDPVCLVNTVQPLSAQLTEARLCCSLISGFPPPSLLSLHLQFNLPPLLWHRRASASYHLGATCSFPMLSLFLSFCQCSPTLSGGSLLSHRLPLLLSSFSPSLLFHPSITPRLLKSAAIKTDAGLKCHGCISNCQNINLFTPSCPASLSLIFFLC